MVNSVVGSINSEVPNYFQHSASAWFESDKVVRPGESKSYDTCFGRYRDCVAIAGYNEVYRIRLVVVDYQVRVTFVVFDISEIKPVTIAATANAPDQN